MNAFNADVASSPIVSVAVVQAAPVAFDLARTLDKVADLTADFQADNGVWLTDEVPPAYLSLYAAGT